MVRQGRLTGPGPRPATDDRRDRGALVRHPEGPAPDQRPVRTGAGRRRSRSASPPGIRQQSGAAGFPAAGARASTFRFRAGPRTGGCARPPRPARAHDGRAPARGRPRGRGRRARRCTVRRVLDRRRLRFAPEVRDDLGEMPGRDRLDARKRGLGCGLGGADESTQAGAPRALGGGENTSNRPDPAVERELSDRRQPTKRVDRKLVRGREDRQCDRKVEPEPSFRSPAGARLTVMRREGHSSSAESIPLRTRCFASWHARSASPTIASPGRPFWRWASTSTLRASSPTRAWVTVRASTVRRYAAKTHASVSNLSALRASARPGRLRRTRPRACRSYG